LPLRLAGTGFEPNAVVSTSLLKRHGISRPPETGGDKRTRMKLRLIPSATSTSISRRCELRKASSYLFVAIDRTSKFAYAELHEEGNRWAASDFLKALIKTVPDKIHIVLTDNGIQLTDLPKNRIGPAGRSRAHMFDMVCDANDTEHRPTKSNHSWTKGQVERMRRHAQRGHGEASAMERMPSSKSFAPS